MRPDQRHACQSNLSFATVEYVPNAAIPAPTGYTRAQLAYTPDWEMHVLIMKASCRNDVLLI